jgi:hypothetical protein
MGFCTKGISSLLNTVAVSWKHTPLIGSTVWNRTAVVWLLKFSRLIEVNPRQWKETRLQKQVQIRSLIRSPGACFIKERDEDRQGRVRNAGEGIYYSDVASNGKCLRRRRMPKFRYFRWKQVAKLFTTHHRTTVQQEMSNIIFAADQKHFDVSHPVPTPALKSDVSSPTTPSSAACSEDVIVSDLTYL